MLKVFAVLCALVVCHGKSLESPDEVYGSYNLVYSWPKLNEYRPNCTKINYSKSILNTPVSCQCGGVQSPLQLFYLTLMDLKFNVVAKVIDSVDQLKDTVSEDCSCSPSDKNRDVIVKINDDYLLHYVFVDKTVFLLSKVVPSAEELKVITSSIPRLSEVEGNLLCQ